ncbi:MAG: 2'-5' RNA ligase family protein [Bacteroidota bacterium]
MKESVERFFIAIIPPQPWYDQVQQLKEQFRDEYGSRGALRSPPHITLHMPFQWPLRRMDELDGLLKVVAAGLAPVDLTFDDFGAFEPRVIFINFMDSPGLRAMQGTLVRQLRTGLYLLNANFRDLPFHPHMTIAFRDLKKDAFRDAWEKFRFAKFAGSFKVTSISLLQHDGAVWKIRQDYPLTNT